MSDLEHRIQHNVKEWVSFADEDLAFAQYGLSATTIQPNRQIAFHAQQSSEKYLKAYLTFCKVDFPYTHDISILIKLCAEKADWIEEISDAKNLTVYASTSRYPGISNVVTREKAIKAVDIATRVRDVVRNALIAEGVEL